MVVMCASICVLLLLLCRLCDKLTKTLKENLRKRCQMQTITQHEFLNFFFVPFHSYSRHFYIFFCKLFLFFACVYFLFSSLPLSVLFSGSFSFICSFYCIIITIMDTSGYPISLQHTQTHTLF